VAEQSLRRAVAPMETVAGSFPAFTVDRRAPRLYVVDGFASDEEVDHVLELTRDLDEWRRRGVEVKRDTTGASFELPVASDEVVTRIVARTYALLGVENQVDYSVRFRHYHMEESHPLHTDTLEINGAHLVATAILCLIPPEAGGATEFPYAAPPVRVPHRRGRLVSWINLRPDGSVDPQAAHVGGAVTAGDKVTITNFIYAVPRCRLVEQGPACLPA
jgi:hypothetical protein